MSTAVVAAARAAFERAARAHPQEFYIRRLLLLDAAVELRIVGRAYAEMAMAALAHQPDAGGGAPQLRIDLWDVAATGVAAPVESVHGALERTWVTGAESLTASASGHVIGYQLHRSLLWFDRPANHMIGWTETAESLTLHQRGKPLQAMFSLWASDRDIQPVHAGLVARDNRPSAGLGTGPSAALGTGPSAELGRGGVLFPGKSGSGKSTASLVCALDGFAFLGDDWAGVQRRGTADFVGHSLYSSTWLEPEHARRFPEVTGRCIAPRHAGEPKALVLLSGVPNLQFASRTRVAALALPRIAPDGRPRVRPATKAEALLVLAPSSLLQLFPRTGARGLERLSQLAEELPAFWLELGPDLRRTPELVAEILRSVG